MKNKKILLAVCGSIAFYKAFEILSTLKKEGFDVYVTLSDGAMNFVDYKAFDALCDHPVLCSKTEDWHKKLSHIEYSKIDLVLIAPASVNTINKLANGICDNVFMQTLIAASRSKYIIAPAANHRMLEHFSTQNSIEKLKEIGAVIIEPEYKVLACKEEGKGGLADVSKILYTIKREFFKDEFYKNKNVIITGGPTIEKIDDVRGITNFSSGKMAKALADAFYFAGANVTLITSVNFDVPYKTIKFETTIGLQSAISSVKINKDDIFIMSAAVNDYVPKYKSRGKLKKDDIGGVWNLKLTQNFDLLSDFALEFPDVKKVGFKLESDEDSAIDSAKEMLINKHLDAVCLNILNDNVKIGGDMNEIYFITREMNKKIKLNSKEKIAVDIMRLIKSL